jgi:RNA polymerase sigma-70 factor (ECF subfamily)
MGRIEEARAAYWRAREITDDGPERRFLDRRLAELPVAGGRATDTV